MNSIDCERHQSLSTVHLHQLNTWIGTRQGWSSPKGCCVTHHALQVDQRDRSDPSGQGAGSERHVHQWPWIPYPQHLSCPRRTSGHQWGCRTMSPVWSQRGHVEKLSHGRSCCEMSSCLVETAQRPTQSKAEEASRVRDQVADS